MALERSGRSLTRCLRCARHDRISLPIRSFSTSTPTRDAETEQISAKPPLDPSIVFSPRLERKLMREQKRVPIASRRRRAAMQTTLQVPFSQLPYQCFQEARKVLQQDRAEKLAEIQLQRERLERLSERAPVGEMDARKRETRLVSMRQRLEELKILADSNDPIVKKIFEDGQADMTKPIYRHLANKKWRAYPREILLQRITQMNLVPDVLPALDPVVSTTLSFPLGGPGTKRKNIQSGAFVPSTLSEHPPYLTIQPFSPGTKLVTLAIVTPDVPAVAKDGFDYRVHYLACNIPISPTLTQIDLGTLGENAAAQEVLPWLPPYSQKGAPYQRLGIFVLEQPPAEKLPPGSGAVAPSARIDVESVVEKKKFAEKREGFVLRSFVTKHRLHPVGAEIFRCKWDEGTAGVMVRAGIAGANVEFKRKKIEPLPYKRLKEVRYR